MSDFWSRRKARVEAEERAEAEAVREAAVRDAEQQQEARPDEELLAEAGLPEPESIDGPDMLREFLNSNLPQRLKRRAMRAHWKSNPVLACMDGLNDYEEDFTTAELIGDAVRTTYQVGRGLLAHVEEMERVANAEAGPEPATEDTADEPGVEAVTADAEIPAPAPAPEIQPDNAEAPDAGIGEDGQAIATASRRMRFRFETT